MGVCSINDEKSRQKIDAKDNLYINGINGDNEISNYENKSNEHIINRISNRTKFTNINNDYIISDNILGKGATGIVREGQDKNGEKYAIKTVWKSDIERREICN